MRISYLVYAFLHTLYTFSLGVDCAAAFAADDLLQAGKDVSSGTPAMHNNLGAQPDPIPDFKATAPKISSSNVPHNLYDQMAGYQRPPTDKDIRKMAASPGKPLIPRYSPEDEWAIKTWWMKNVHPIGKRFLEGVQTLVLTAPTLLVKNLGPTIEKGYAKPVLQKIVPRKKGVWEILPEPAYKSVLDKLAAEPSFPEKFSDWLMRKGSLGINWVKNQIGPAPKKVSLTLAQHFERLMKHFQGKAEVKNLEELPKSRNKWKIPQYPPALSADPMVKRAYDFGTRIDALSKSKSTLDSINPIKDDIVKNFDGNPVAKYHEPEKEKLKEFLTSDKHIKLLERLHQKTNELMHQHQEMQKTLDLVVSTLGGEKETKNMFIEILESHEDIVNNKSNPKAKPKTEENEAEEEKVEKKKIEDKTRYTKHAPFASLEAVLPGAYDFHLSPLLFLKEILENSSDEIVGLKATRGYLHDGLPRLEIIQTAAEKVEKYAEVARHVDKLQKAVLGLRRYVFGLRRGDFKDESTMAKNFKDFFEPEDVWHTGMKSRKPKNDPATNDAANSNAANSDAANRDAANHDAAEKDAANNDAADDHAGPSNDPSKNDAANNDAANDDAGPSDDPSKNLPHENDPVNNDPPKDDPPNNNPPKDNPAKDDPPKTNPPKDNTDSPES